MSVQSHSDENASADHLPTSYFAFVLNGFLAGLLTFIGTFDRFGLPIGFLLFAIGLGIAALSLSIASHGAWLTSRGGWIIRWFQSRTRIEFLLYALVLICLIASGSSYALGFLPHLIRRPFGVSHETLPLLESEFLKTVVQPASTSGGLQGGMIGKDAPSAIPWLQWAALGGDRQEMMTPTNVASNDAAANNTPKVTSKRLYWFRFGTFRDDYTSTSLSIQLSDSVKVNQIVAFLVRPRRNRELLDFSTWKQIPVYVNPTRVSARILAWEPSTSEQIIVIAQLTSETANVVPPQLSLGQPYLRVE